MAGKGFSKGHKKFGGRTKGAPNRTSLDIRQLARQYTTEALETLVSILWDTESGASARVSAANILLDRAWGKPTQSVDDNVNGSVAVYVITGVPRSDRQ
jgi:hypothetical protein